MNNLKTPQKPKKIKTKSSKKNNISSNKKTINRF